MREEAESRIALRSIRATLAILIIFCPMRVIYEPSFLVAAMASNKTNRRYAKKITETAAARAAVY